MSYLRVGVCDDETQDLIEILEMIKLYDERGQLQVTSFLHATDILAAFKELKFDVVILDIEMTPPTGFDIAKELVRSENPPVIIFATKSNAYAMRGYGIAIRYLQKPIKHKDFSEAMDAAIADAIAHRLTFQIDSIMFSLPLRDIQYIEAFGHYTVVHTAQNEYRFRSALKNVVARLPKGYFASPHKSYVVNLEHIRSASTAEVVLDCGDAVPIGRKRMQEFNEALYRFLGR